SENPLDKTSVLTVPPQFGTFGSPRRQVCRASNVPYTRDNRRQRWPPRGRSERSGNCLAVDIRFGTDGTASSCRAARRSQRRRTRTLISQHSKQTSLAGQSSPPTSARSDSVSTRVGGWTNGTSDHERAKPTNRN